MIYAVWFPLFVPLLAVPVGRRIAEGLAPRTAAWTLGLCAALLASCSTAALSMLALFGVLRLAPFAALADFSPRWMGDHTLLTVPAAWLAMALLLLGVTKLTSATVGTLRELRTARAADGARASGELSVRPDVHPYAYALPGGRGRPGRIVVSSAMLRALGPREREALFAHERAHLSGRHHLFLTTMQLAAALHPMLRGLREPLTFALERWADESAATAVGDRRLAARAIGRAALAAHAAPPPAGCPATVLAVSSGPVPRRVAALLESAAPGSPTRRPVRWVAAALLACLAVTTATSLHAAVDLHTTVEIAQSDTASH